MSGQEAYSEALCFAETTRIGVLDAGCAGGAGTDGALPCQRVNNCITGAQRRSKLACELNVLAMFERHGRGRCFFLTLTTRDNCLSLVEGQRRWHSFLTNFGSRVFLEGVVVRERQKRGAWHYQAVVRLPFEYSGVEAFPWNEVKEKCYKHVERELLLLWGELRRAAVRYGFGRSELLPLRKTGLAAGRYLAKYVGKSFADPYDGGRRWSVWGDAYRARCRLDFVRSPVRAFVGYAAAVLGFTDYWDFKRVLGPRWGKVLLGWCRSGREYYQPWHVKALGALLRAGFWEDARWLSIQWQVFPSLSEDEVVSFKPHLEGLFTWEVVGEGGEI